MAWTRQLSPEVWDFYGEIMPERHVMMLSLWDSAIANRSM